jgi:hypothetical protein
MRLGNERIAATLKDTNANQGLEGWDIKKPKI